MSQPPNQPPYPGEPYNQPGPGQPYGAPPPSSGGPYGAPPPSGQPYGAQPPSSGGPYGAPGPYGTPGGYQGQPNPDVPSSVPPGYPPQPEYAQQGAYGQPGAPFQQQPPKKKSKVLPIVLISLAVLLVLCVGGGTAIYLVGKNTVDDVADAIASAAPTGPVTTPDGGTTTTEPAEDNSSKITVVEPKTLGGRPKLTDPQFAGAAEELEQGLKQVPDATDTVGALYGTPSKQDIVIVAAAAAKVSDPEKELDNTFLGAGIGGLKLTGITEASPGDLGGAAKCGKSEAGGADLIMCGWADEGSIGWVIWYFKSMSSAKAEFPKLRAQLEKKS
ncbi:hypothetical protein [Actinoplanes sp. TFC3]|uniref:hypothetical protein n=1 Tax=Actinoplanes sp. TFC3 TaxID=1710355 RepID=UPI000A587466|nr:hypothetical protein [Actinoplanes sp. TFC3]